MKNEKKKKTTTKKRTTKKKTIKKRKTRKKTTAIAVKTKVPAPLTQDQLLFILQKTPTDHIYQRPAKGGGKWDYVTGAYVKKVLNYCFGWRWDFEIKEHGKEKSLVWVLGRLTIKDKRNNPIVVKEQFGRADIKTKKGTDEALDYGNDLKASATDALKKCASELGIASDIYAGNEFKEIQKEDKGYTPPKEIIDVEVEDKKNKKEELKAMLTGKTDEEKRKDLDKKTGIKLKRPIDEITENHATTLIINLLNKKTK